MDVGRGPQTKTALRPSATQRRLPRRGSAAFSCFRDGEEEAVVDTREAFVPMIEGDLVPIGEAAKRVGRSPHTLRKLVRAGELPAYAQPLDRRLRLVRLADVEALRAPRRFDPKEEPMPAA